MPTAINKKAGTFSIGGDVVVNRMGFGAMRLTGPGIWGDPADTAEAIRVLRRLPELGINFIDTADSYGPDASELLIRTALCPYDNLLVATKGGLVRSGPDLWTPLGKPEYLIQQAYKSLRNLGVEQLGLWQLHRIDPHVPRDEQFGAVKHLLDTGVIRHAGLSEVTVDEIDAASRVFRVATVQNRYNLLHRASEDVVRHCETHGIGFIPWFPLAAGLLATSESLAPIATRHHASAGQIALAWLLKRSPAMIVIPGTSSVAHLEQNAAAADIELSAEEFDVLNQIDSNQVEFDASATRQ